MKFILSLLILFSFNLLHAQEVNSNQIIEADHINNLVIQYNELYNKISGKTITERVTLWQGNKYLNTSSTYNLWDISKHQNWDSIEIYVGFDNPSNGQKFEIILGDQYSYTSTDLKYRTLIWLHGERYRRLLIRKTGIDVYNGNDSYFTLKKVVGVIKRTIN